MGCNTSLLIWKKINMKNNSILRKGKNDLNGTKDIVFHNKELITTEHAGNIYEM